MRVVVALDRPAAGEPIRKVLLGMGLECAAADCVSHGDLPVRLSRDPADLVLVRAGADPEPALQALRQAVPLTRSPVLVAGPAADAPQVLRYLQGGAREFLDEGRLEADLEQVLGRLRESGRAGEERGLLVGVLGATPGCGVSTIAANVAFALAEGLPGRVALMELGRGPADLALTLDLGPRHTTADVTESHDRLDATLLRQSLLGHPEGVQVLPHPEGAGEPRPVPAAVVRKTLILARSAFAATVLDLGHVPGEEQVEAARLADAVVLVVRLDVPGLRQARRLREALTDDHGVSAGRLVLVANRFGQRGQVAWRKAAEAVGAEFAEYIPDDPGRLNAARNLGRPVVTASRIAGVSRRLRRLAGRLVGQATRKSPGRAAGGA